MNGECIGLDQPKEAVERLEILLGQQNGAHELVQVVQLGHSDEHGNDELRWLHEIEAGAK